MALGWIDYQKAYDLALHSQILENKKLSRMTNNALKLMKKGWNTLEIV